MSSFGSRFAVVIVDRFKNEQHLERHRPSDYVARVISNTQGREMTEHGRNYVFGGTPNQVDFYEANSQKEAEEIAEKFNRLWEKGIYQDPRKLKQVETLAN